MRSLSSCFGDSRCALDYILNLCSSPLLNEDSSNIFGETWDEKIYTKPSCMIADNIARSVIDGRAEYRIATAFIENNPSPPKERRTKNGLLHHIV